MMNSLFITLLLPLALGQWAVQTEREGNCSGRIYYQSARNLGSASSCNAIASPCSLSSGPLSNVYLEVTCSTTRPTLANLGFQDERFDGATCSTPGDHIETFLTNACIRTFTSGASRMYTCGTNTALTNSYTTNDCSGTPTTTTETTNQCIPTSTMAVSDRRTCSTVNGNQLFSLILFGFTSNTGVCNAGFTEYSPRTYQSGTCISIRQLSGNALNIQGSFALTVNDDTAVGTFHASSDDCTGTGVGIVAPQGDCFNVASNPSFDATFFWNQATTTATTTAGGGGGGATTTAATSAPSSNPCFHEDTVITYGGAQLALKDLQSHQDCRIPHIVQAQGVIVTAQCGDSQKRLRLTDGHLVYTQRGLQPAASVTTKDTVYADIGETAECRVVSVTKEQKTHKYFGLNCYTSQVLADGLKTSTFEKLHSVPSFWMAVVGRVLGIKHASAIGDHIAELVAKLNLV